MSTGYIWYACSLWHDAGYALRSPWSEPYPALDRPETRRRLHSLVEVSGLIEKLVEIPVRLATEEELLRFHTAEYVQRIRHLSEAGGGEAGENAWFGPGAYTVASLAVGGCLAAVDAVLIGKVDNAYALVRPCGHHAEPDRGRGFCIFGNVALAVRHAQAVYGVERVAVIDWDVHHGNGTEQAFYAERDVLTISLHQERCYPPDTGNLADVGESAGAGFNLNVALPPGSGHGTYVAAMQQVVLPAVAVFRPDLVIVASGYDAAAGDPLGRMFCYSDTFREMARGVKQLADNLCDGRLVVCHEGGYSPTYVPFCGLAVIEELAGERTPVDDPLTDWYANVGGQCLQPHQASRLAEAAAQHERFLTA